MNIFDLRQSLVDDYSSYIKSFIEIRNERIREYVQRSLFKECALWPEPLIQLNPMFEPGHSVDELVAEGLLHASCAQIFRRNKEPEQPYGLPLQLHRHQEEAIRAAHTGQSYVLTTGTGSGKSLAYMIPIVDYVLRHPRQSGIKAIVVYPMNALANSQLGELEKYLPLGERPVTFRRYTGQEKGQERDEIIANPPDILLTNYVMLELILTRKRERDLLHATQLRFLVLDELHTYRGRQGADVALLVRRVRDRLTPAGQPLQCVGTSATLAGGGTYDEQRRDVSAMAAHLFGCPVAPEHVIGETLVRVTQEVDESAPNFRRALTQRVTHPTEGAPQDYEQFRHDALSTWLESTFGVTRSEGRLVRTKPRRISGEHESAAELLHEATGATEVQCVEAIKQGLLTGYEQILYPPTGRAPFAFRLHQFISKGDTVYASLGHDPARHITLQYQQYAPGGRERILLPLAFCRECGQEYYSVRRQDDLSFSVRELQDQLPYTNESDGKGTTRESKPGFLYIDSDDLWPREREGIEARLPDEWKELRNGKERITSSARKNVPQPLRVRPDGSEVEESDHDGVPCFFVPAPFRFCLHCETSYSTYLDNDFEKLGRLSSEGRSTATTILSLATIRQLRSYGEGAEMAAKLLSFTDNRQDASLQAGHFNDFVEIGLLRSALYRAVHDAGSAGLQHDTLTQRVFEALRLAPNDYAVNPELKYSAKINTERALRNVLGYRLYLDLRRGWRITAPNLEQCGLLEIEYLDLDEACKDPTLWQPYHESLRIIAPNTRLELCRTLLDHMRRELAIKVDYLNPTRQEEIKQQSSQHLIEPWSIDEDERMTYATRLFPKSKEKQDYSTERYLSGLSNYGRYVRRLLRDYESFKQLKADETEKIIRDLLKALCIAGLVEEVQEARTPDDAPGYQLPASALIWRTGDNTRPYHDPLRMPRLAHEQQKRVNPFFVRFYQENAEHLEQMQHVHAKEHTAQVPGERREEREKEFRAGTLPILYCSPTMELGIDIAQLNVVNMRNIPPTPANYAQRSGRAGRSGQPALVFSYCSTGNAHDQYFFQHPSAMVSGAVTPPRLDLTNEDLLRAHIYAIWLAESDLSLGESLKDLLDVVGDAPTLALQPHVLHALHDTNARRKAEAQARHMLQTIPSDSASWTSSNWLENVFDALEANFKQACERWIGLYRAAQYQRDTQNAVIRDASRTEEDKKQAKRLRAEAEAQLEMLTASSTSERSELSEFYSYRYFASEGFLPGYSFPRLPLSAYIPARHSKQRDEYLSRPRFLAISEFAPRAIIYHEGSRYIINRSILTVRDDRTGVLTTSIKQCAKCGYLHLLDDQRSIDVCERCGHLLGEPLRQLFKLQNVSTRRRDRISSEEEERRRQGYLIRTGVVFSRRPDGQASSYMHYVRTEAGEQVARLTYGQTARLWRINFGPTRRNAKNGPGFVLDTERGYWEKEDEAATDPSDPMSGSKLRVLPYVEDTRNCLLFEPLVELNHGQMASLQAALKSAIQVRYQLEDNELAAEPLPSMQDRKLLLLYEAAEGGAGVLRQLSDDRRTLAEVAREALLLCHFDPQSGEDRHRAPRAPEDCEAACYHCLLTYANQRDHALLDRQSIKDYLLTLSRCFTVSAPSSTPGTHVRETAREEGFAVDNDEYHELERHWLQHVQARKLSPPMRIHTRVDQYDARPDFLYRGLAIYVDGDDRTRQARDAALVAELENSGYTVLRFGALEAWDRLFDTYADMMLEEH